MSSKKRASILMHHRLRTPHKSSGTGVIWNPEDINRIRIEGEAPDPGAAGAHGNFVQRNYAKLKQYFEDRKLAMAEAQRFEKVLYTDRFIILPTTLWKQLWDILILLMVMYTVVIIPIAFGFAEPEVSTARRLTPTSLYYFVPEEHGLDIVDAIVDAFFVTDIVLTFFTAYVGASGELEVKLKGIKNNYLRGFFFVDVLASFPYELVGTLFGGSFEGGSYKIILKALKLPRLLRVSRIFKFFENFEHANSWRVFRLYTIVLMFVHWSLCLFTIIVATDEYSRWYDVNFIHVIHPTMAEKYWGGAYATLQMLFSGGMRPTTNAERAFGTFMRLIGAVVQASIFGNVAMLLANANAKALQRRKKIDEVNLSMRNMGLPTVLQDRVREYFDYYWTVHAQHNSRDNQWMNDLSESLHDTITLTVNRNMIHNVPLFSDVHPNYLLAIVRRLKYAVVLPGDFIVHSGTVGKQMFFINKGTVTLMRNTHRVATLGSGDHFGELALLEDNTQRVLDVISRTFVDLSILSRKDFIEVSEDFPEDRESFARIATSKKTQALMGMNLFNVDEVRQVSRSYVDGAAETDTGVGVGGGVTEGGGVMWGRGGGAAGEGRGGRGGEGGGLLECLPLKRWTMTAAAAEPWRETGAMTLYRRLA